MSVGELDKEREREKRVNGTYDLKEKLQYQPSDLKESSWCDGECSELFAQPRTKYSVRWYNHYNQSKGTR